MNAPDVSSLPGFIAIIGGLMVFFIAYGVLAPIKPKKSKTISDDVFGPQDAPVADPNDFTAKYSRPLLDNFAQQLPENFIPKSSKASYETLLRVSGNPLKITAEELFSLQIVFALIGFVIGIGVAATGLLDMLPFYVPPLFLGLLAFFLPYVYHTSLKNKREKDISKNLPEALDLIQVIISTGSSFQSALKKTSLLLPESFLKTEFIRASLGLQAGTTLESVMHSFISSNSAEEAETFGLAVIQTQKLGADITDTLVRQAALSRSNHEAKINEKIARLNTTLFIPMALFMVPAFLAIFMVPTIVSIGNILG